MGDWYSYHIRSVTRPHGGGVRLTVAVAKTIKGIREGRDEQLERALETLK